LGTRRRLKRWTVPLAVPVASCRPQRFAAWLSLEHLAASAVTSTARSLSAAWFRLAAWRRRSTSSRTSLLEESSTPSSTSRPTPGTGRPGASTSPSTGSSRWGSRAHLAQLPSRAAARQPCRHVAPGWPQHRRRHHKTPSAPRAGPCAVQLHALAGRPARRHHQDVRGVTVVRHAGHRRHPVRLRGHHLREQQPERHRRRLEGGGLRQHQGSLFLQDSGCATWPACCSLQ
jgi:hypothetical protein